MNGFAARGQNAAEGVDTPLTARALAVGDNDHPNVIVSLPVLGIPRALHQAIAADVQSNFALPKDRLLLASSHTHSGPVLTDNLAPQITFGLSADNLKIVDAYTTWFRKGIVDLIGRALDARKLGPTVSIAYGVRDLADSGLEFAVTVSASNTSTTIYRSWRSARQPTARLSPRYSPIAAIRCICSARNTIRTGQAWRPPGSRPTIQAQQRSSSRAAPETSILAAGLSNPTRCIRATSRPGRTPWSRRRARTSRPRCNPCSKAACSRSNPSSRPPTRRPACLSTSTSPMRTGRPSRRRLQAIYEKIQTDNPGDDVYGRHATRMIAELKNGTSPQAVPLPIAVWQFGSTNPLRLVALGGEVVTDYAQMLRKLFPSARLWVASYANEVPSYIPSDGMMSSGGCGCAGYERGWGNVAWIDSAGLDVTRFVADGSMMYYGWPSPYQAGANSPEAVLIASVLRMTAAPPAGTTIYGTRSNGALQWYKHLGFNDGSIVWSGPFEVGNGWQDFKQTFAGSDGAIYAIKTDGTLQKYKHQGYVDGGVSWSGPTTIGRSWQNFQYVFSAGEGVLYSVKTDGTLEWYKQVDRPDGTTLWSGPKNVGTSSPNSRFFAGGLGVMYTIRADGTLQWSKHNGYLDGSASWLGPKDVGTAWQDFKQVLPPGGGVIYAIRTDGTLLWFKHLGYADGSGTWLGPIEVGSGWQEFPTVMARLPSVS